MGQKKIESKILITNKLGLHARAAAKFVEYTSKCSSLFTVKKGNKTVNGSSLLGLMTLAASKGTEIKVQSVGKNAEKDLHNLINLVKNNFGEEKPLSENINREMIFKGIGASGGYAIGNCLIKQKSIISHSRYNIPTSMVAKEISRLEKAVKASILDIRNELLPISFLISIKSLNSFTKDIAKILIPLLTENLIALMSLSVKGGNFILLLKCTDLLDSNKPSFTTFPIKKFCFKFFFTTLISKLSKPIKILLSVLTDIKLKFG